MMLRLSKSCVTRAFSTDGGRRFVYGEGDTDPRERPLFNAEPIKDGEVPRKEAYILRFVGRLNPLILADKDSIY
jgi:hypothetical protein